MRVLTGLTSPFPRPEPLVQASRDFDRGRVSAERVDALYRSTEEEVDALERRIGLGVRTAGYVRWPDLYRPIAERWDGFAVGPLTRWLETNTFFRQPILLAPPVRVPGAFASGLPAPLRAAPAGARVLLPGPYSLARLLDNRSGETDAAVVHRLGRLLGEEAAALANDGFSEFLLPDPLLVRDPPEGPLAEATVAAYRAVQAGVGAGRATAWTYGGDARPALPLLDRLHPTVVGIDLTETEPDALPAAPRPGPVGFGVLDSRTTLAEEPEEIARIAHDAARRRGATEVLLGPAGPLDLLPWGPAARKAEQLARVPNARSGGPA